MGYQYFGIDSCIFVRRKEKSLVYIALYVDGMLIGTRTLEVINEISDKLSKLFKLKELRKVKSIWEYK